MPRSAPLRLGSGYLPAALRVAMRAEVLVVVLENGEQCSAIAEGYAIPEW